MQWPFNNSKNLKAIIGGPVFLLSYRKESKIKQRAIWVRAHVQKDYVG